MGFERAHPADQVFPLRLHSEVYFALRLRDLKRDKGSDEHATSVRQQMPEVHPAYILDEHYQQRGSMEAMPPNPDKARNRATEMEVDRAHPPKTRGQYHQGCVHVEAAWEQAAGPAGAHVAAHLGRRAAGGRAELEGRGSTGAG